MPDFAKSLFSFGGFTRSNTATTVSSTSSGDSKQTTPTSSAVPSPVLRALKENKPISAVTQSNAEPTFRAPSATSAISLGGLADHGFVTGQGSSDIGSRTSSAMSTVNNSDSESATTTSPVDASLVVRPKGKLRVRIVEARNLMARSNSSCPYVVCSFDTSEYVSRGPAGAAIDTANEHPTGIAIPTGNNRSRQSSSLALSKMGGSATNPMWKDEAQFDVTSDESLLDIYIYDAKNNDMFLGRAQIRPDLNTKLPVDKWLTLESRISGEHVSGEVRVSMVYERVAKRQYGPEDFDILRLVGKGTFGQVYQVRKKDTKRVYAMKVLSKKAIIQKKEVAHTIGERNILVRTSSVESAFIVGLKMSFQTPTDLYLVTDYMSGGELFWHLQKEGRFSEERAKFYIAELIVALEHLHDNDIVYRDLKPENILLDANGHIALCDFGLSKANLNGGTTNTFCGTTEYLAPEVLLDDHGYTKMVDFWSLGVLVFEMCCGWSPFYAEDNQQMYKNIAFGKVRFPKDALSPEGRNFVKGLLNRNPKHRLGANGDARELREHPFFSDVDWNLLVQKKIPPPFKPNVASETDTSNFDPEFTQASTSAFRRGLNVSSTPLSPGIQDTFRGFTYVNSPMEETFRAKMGMGTSYRPRSHIAQDDDIDLYDDKDIQISASYYNESDLLARSLAAPSAIPPQSQHQLRHETDEDGDVGMMDDDDHDFVGQQFEM